MHHLTYFFHSWGYRKLPWPVEHFRHSNLCIPWLRAYRSHRRGSPEPEEGHPKGHQADILAYPLFLRPLGSPNRHHRPLQFQTTLIRNEAEHRSISLAFRSCYHRKRDPRPSWLHQRLHPDLRLFCRKFRSLCRHTSALFPR